jgi:phosphoribosylamine--glycine ligase/phosphoribosylformylglycinamidine cyclo-ligase
VSVDAGNDLVERIKPFVRATRRTGADAEIGGFGGVFDLKAVGYTDPVLVSGTDGVGTKLHVAKECGVHDTIGIDLVAMSVNDLLVQGAEPLYFLDYFGCSKLDVDTASAVVQGIAKGCEISGCALIGGETAEMPGMYQKGAYLWLIYHTLELMVLLDDYDLAGFAVGAVERTQLLPTPDIQAGDVLLGLPSAGLHSNGFSLARKVVARAGLTYTSPCPWNAERTLGQEYLEPTRIYVKQLLPLVKTGGLIKGMVHITGGGFIENIPRVLPKGVGCFVDASTWRLPEVFTFIMREGNVQPLEMARTFNSGIGMVLVVAKEKVTQVMSLLKEEEVVEIGALTEGEGVEMRNLEKWNV